VFNSCEFLPQPLESCEWDGDDVCSCVVKYVCVMSLDLDSGLTYVDVFICSVFFDVQG
jgi:hypothetical protein